MADTLGAGGLEPRGHSMAWFANHYVCYQCDNTWIDEWSCQCDGECPRCGAGDCTPYDSEDLTGLIEQDAGEYVVYVSPASAEHEPDYEEIGRYMSKQIAEKIMTRHIETEWRKAFGEA